MDAILYVERRPLQREDVLDVLRYLWSYGADFLIPASAYGGTWEGLLQARGGLSWGRYAGMTFSEMVNAIVGEGRGRMPLYDRGAELRLLLDTNMHALADELLDDSSEIADEIADLPYGRIGVSVNTYFMHPEDRIPPSAETPAAGTYIPPHAYLLSPYTQIHYAVVQWVELLCLKLKPICAFSVDTNGLAKDESEFYAHGDGAFMHALRQGRLPPIDEWVRRPEILYVSSRFVSTTVTQRWLSSQGRWAKVLPSGGLLSYAVPEKYETPVAEDLIRQGTALFQSGERQQARALYLRARVIFAALGDNPNMGRCDVLIEGVSRSAM